MRQAIQHFRLLILGVVALALWCAVLDGTLAAAHAAMPITPFGAPLAAATDVPPPVHDNSQLACCPGTSQSDMMLAVTATLPALPPPSAASVPERPGPAAGLSIFDRMAPHRSVRHASLVEQAVLIRI